MSVLIMADGNGTEQRANKHWWGNAMANVLARCEALMPVSAREIFTDQVFSRALTGSRADKNSRLDIYA